MLKNQRTKNKGITLIALVLTIIVMLILAAISISMLTGDNSILKRATDSKKNTEESQITEEAKIDILAKITDNEGKAISKKQLKDVLKNYFNEEEVEKLVIPDDLSSANDELTTKDEKYKIKLSDIYNGKVENRWEYDHALQTVENGNLTLKIGDYVNDTETQSVSGFDEKWRVLGTENGQLLLVTATYYAPFEEDATNGIERASSGSVGPDIYGLQLSGKDGYDNGVARLNKIGEQYNNSKLEKGRSINTDDINKITGYNPKNIGVNDTMQNGIGTPFGNRQIWQYKNKVTYTLEGGKVYYQGTDAVTTRTLSSQNTFKPLGETDNIIASYTVNESTAYYYYPTTLTETPNNEASVGLSIESPAYDMLFKTPVSYWLASYCIFALNGYANWNYYYVSSSGMVASQIVWRSSIGTRSNIYGVRPVVSLKSTITPNFVSKDESTGISTYEI